MKFRAKKKKKALAEFLELDVEWCGNSMTSALMVWRHVRQQYTLVHSAWAHCVYNTRVRSGVCVRVCVICNAHAVIA